MNTTSVATSVAKTAPVRIDGRNRRVEETKRKIIAAALAIVAEGQELTAVSTARWADVSDRSVFQHCGSVEGLHVMVRRSVLMGLVDDLVSIQHLDGQTVQVRAFNALANLQTILFDKPKTVRQIEWTFSGSSDPDSDLADTEILFNDKLLSLAGMIIGKETRELLNQSQAGRYAELRLSLGTLLNPKTLVPLFSSVSLVAVHHMVVGTVKEFIRAASKPA